MHENKKKSDQDMIWFGLKIIDQFTDAKNIENHVIR